jgi:Uma2 family endonuclease
LPYKIELNKEGQLVLSPVKFLHSLLQKAIMNSIEDALGESGKAVSDVAVATADNTKVPDVVWMSVAFIREHLREDELSAAPEICVEVVSPSNTALEMKRKMALFFERGARECWLCDLNGRMRFFTPEGESTDSILAPLFPRAINLEAWLE